MNEVALVPQPNVLAPVDVLASPPAVQPSAGVLLSEYRFHGCGIYGIENTKTGVFYVGQTLDFWVRIRTELNDLRVGDHHCRHLQRSFNKHGEQSFRLHVLELCADQELNGRELFWIHQKTASGVFNSKISSDCGRFWTVTDDHCRIQSENKKLLFSLPLWGHAHQKKLWSDGRKKICRVEYLARIIQLVCAKGYNVSDSESLKALLGDMISNGLTTGQIQERLGFYKLKLYRVYDALGIDRGKLYMEWCAAVSGCGRGEVKRLCSKYGASVKAAYTIRSRMKKPALISQSGPEPKHKPTLHR